MWAKKLKICTRQHVAEISEKCMWHTKYFIKKISDENLQLCFLFPTFLNLSGLILCVENSVKNAKAKKFKLRYVWYTVD